MRLIDADRLIELSERYETFIDRKSVETAPTAEAIPLELLEDLLKDEEVPQSMKVSVSILLASFKSYTIINDLARRVKNGQS